MTGAKLRAIRKEMGMTQKQLAAELELNETSIAMMERGERPIMKITTMAVAYLQSQQQTKAFAPQFHKGRNI